MWRGCGKIKLDNNLEMILYLPSQSQRIILKNIKKIIFNFENTFI